MKTLVVPYGPWELKWVLVSEKEGIVDVMPAPNGLPDDEDQVYDTYSIANAFTSLLSPPTTEATLALEAKTRFHARQLERLPATLHADAIDTLLVGTKRVEINLSYEVVQGARCGVVVVLDRSSFACVETRLSLPRVRCPASCAAFKEPELCGSLDAYVKASKDAFEGPWRRRKAVCEELQRSYALVDWDDVDYSKAHLVIQLKDDRSKRLFLIEVVFEADFPAKPPTMTLRDYARGGEPCVLDRQRYLYSPRWEPQRVATELCDHACRQFAALDNA